MLSLFWAIVISNTSYQPALRHRWAGRRRHHWQMILMYTRLTSIRQVSRRRRQRVVTTNGHNTNDCKCDWRRHYHIYPRWVQKLPLAVLPISSFPYLFSLSPFHFFHLNPSKVYHSSFLFLSFCLLNAVRGFVQPVVLLNRINEHIWNATSIK